LYQRTGKRVYSIGYKQPDGTWLFRYQCDVDDKQQIAKLRRDAIRRVVAQSESRGALTTISQLIDAWFEFQESLPAGSERKRAPSTLAENHREANNLRDVFGHMPIVDLEPHHAYEYLDKCEQLGRPAKGNKEVSLLQTILGYAVRRGILKTHPLQTIEKLPVAPSVRYVKDHELGLVLTVGRELGGASKIVALALQVAYLCVRRSVEVRDLRRHHITDEGIVWVAGKRQAGQPKRQVTIEWSPALRSLIDEALAIQRAPDATGDHVFGTLRGARYTKGGWKANLSRLMQACVERAKEQGIAFEPFSLQDLRPKAVSDKLDARHDDVLDATLHTSERMIRQVYDRRPNRTAKPSR
jgi:integrase